MAEPYIGEIRMFSGNFAPANWALCNGQVLSISENETLYNLLGTTYGGDGVTSFGLPDLRGRAPMHMTTGYSLGQLGGSESVTLTRETMAPHTHTAMAQSANGTSSAPAGRYWAGAGDFICFSKADPDVTFSPAAINVSGGSLPHENMMPFLAMTFIIATAGIYPSPA